MFENLNGHNGHILNYVDDIRQHNYNPIRYYSDHDRTTTLAKHSLAQDDERPPPSYVSYNRRIVHKCRKRRQLRREFKNIDTLTRIAQLPLQVTSNQPVSQFFNGLPF